LGAKKNDMMRSMLVGLWLCFGMTVQAQKGAKAIGPDIIPKPVSMKVMPGVFRLSQNTRLVVPGPADKDAADFFNEYLQKHYGFSLTMTGPATSDYISVKSEKAIDSTGSEKYSLTITPKAAFLLGKSPDGTFRGIQTLIQLLPVIKSSQLMLPIVAVVDEPRFRYRGLHLDVGRHFFGVDDVKDYIDYIALHKLNYFHWHLTEDQGWRIEIKKYPKLTEVGAWRAGTIIGRYPGTGNDSTRYGGFYTQEEIKDVVAYATRRHITVIPEIEMPGHSGAALASYPYLGCTGGPYKVKETWGVFKDVYCAGNDSVFAFLQDVLDEVIPLFPAAYVHIGGDECPKDSWKVCPKCQKRMKELHLKDEHALQSYFVQRMEKYINSKGKRIIGWDEILEGGLAPDATVMSWRGEAGGIEAARRNHDVLMTPGHSLYLDHSQDRAEDSVTIGGYLNVRTMYDYNPVPATLTAGQKKHILGAQANLWTEYVCSKEKLQYMLFPRIAPLSEMLWTKESNKNWDDFEKRLPTEIKRYDLWGVNYSKAPPDDPEKKPTKPKSKLSSDANK
jgi:hexosaminidase